ncbi:MAG: response regulator [Candidatus Cloacimonetes bacterium]|nr:response regulator [Candidatus Cloacimonadota bacterium]
MKRILIIDDDKNLCKILSKLLEREGYTTESVYSGNEALEILFKKHYDFMIVDYNLPDISGMDILQWIVKHKPTVGRIMISAYGNDIIKSDVLRQNTLFFDKPFNNQLLINTIKAYMTHIN